MDKRPIRGFSMYYGVFDMKDKVGDLIYFTEFLDETLNLYVYKIAEIDGDKYRGCPISDPNYTQEIERKFWDKSPMEAFMKYYSRDKRAE